MVFPDPGPPRMKITFPTVSMEACVCGDDWQLEQGQPLFWVEVLIVAGRMVEDLSWFSLY